MGNCIGATASVCCPNSSWAAMGGRGLPSQLTFDYDEIDDLEFENLLNDPHGPHGAFGIQRHAAPFWDRLAALFRHRREGPSGVGYLGGYRAGGYQAVPTGAPGGFGAIHYDDDEFLRHEEDAELMSNEQIKRITSFVKGQTQTDATGESSGYEEPQPARNDPLIEVATETDIPEPITEPPATSASAPKQAASLPAPRPMNTFTTFRAKRRASAAASAVSAATLFGSSQISSSIEDGSKEDDGFGQFQTATPPNEAANPLDASRDEPAPAEREADAPPAKASTQSTIDELEAAEHDAPAEESSVPTAQPEPAPEEAKETVRTDPLQAVEMDAHA